ncbi:alcohol dehydrogenase catalytic domain-containing protein (plasmid) [Deinococcus sp. KNUC1210]|uniref:zinc-dependent alcohol dehydrogenase n=1 Tax=Deinococcus sp. KNUC1210 TaxID=2917691 RepID=UPI001EF0E1B2|nr:alcohol dehydrogenase catalytic domain-containing protein [Deinococcus sp. KNUC1210]ULH14266.1 alcohol dehydrogenase catalytic domain-containing protein [Deinococcus sp. KNUC1210]
MTSPAESFAQPTDDQTAAVPTMAAAIMQGAHHIEYGRIVKPTVLPGHVLIRVQANSVCGSDLHYWHEGRIGSAVVATAFTPGHEFAGVIAEGSGEPFGLPDGTLVAVDPAQPCGHCYWCHQGKHHLCPNMTFVGAPPVPGAMAEFIAVPFSSIHQVPAGFTATQAALLEPLGVAMHALDLAKMRPGTHLAILGAGTIGLYVLMLAQISGALSTAVIEPLAYRRQKALDLGATQVFEDVASYQASVRDTPERGADVVIEATTSPLGPRHATEVVRIGGKVVLVGIPDGDEFSLTGSLVRRKGLTIKLSRRMGNIYPRATEFVRSGRIDVNAIVTHTLPLSQVRQAFEMLADYQDNAIKVVLEP